ncbi:MAG: AI-2E family transporter [Lachnospiraceae bacterium]
MNKQRITTKKVIVLAGITAMVYFAFRFMVPLILPFLIAGIITKILYPLVCRINGKIRIAKGAAAGILTGILLLVLAVVFLWMVKLGLGMLPELLKTWNHVWNSLTDFAQICCTKAEGITKVENGTYYHTIYTSLMHYEDRISRSLIPTLCANGSKIAIFFLGAVSILLITVISTVLLTKDYEKIGACLRRSPLGKACIRMVRRTKKAGGAYLRAQTLLLFMTSVMSVAGLYFIGIKDALWKGVLIGLCDALPFLGTGTILLPWSLVRLFQKDYKQMIGFILLYLTCSGVRQVLEPKLIGKGIGIPALGVVMGIYIGIQVYGAIGILYGPLSFLLIKEIYEEICSVMTNAGKEKLE